MNKLSCDQKSCAPPGLQHSLTPQFVHVSITRLMMVGVKESSIKDEECFLTTLFDFQEVGISTSTLCITTSTHLCTIITIYTTCTICLSVDQPHSQACWNRPGNGSNNHISQLTIHVVTPLMYIPTDIELQGQAWYHSWISRETAEERLNKVPYHCFLIRENDDNLSLSMKHQGGIAHFPIEKDASRYELTGTDRKFDTLLQLVDFFMTNSISGDLTNRLSSPCPRPSLDGECNGGHDV